MSTRIINIFKKGYNDMCAELKARIRTECVLDAEQTVALNGVFDSIRPPEPKSEKPKRVRAPTQYNLFMRTAIRELRVRYPDMSRTDLMRHGAKQWNEHKSKHGVVRV